MRVTMHAGKTLYSREFKLEEEPLKVGFQEINHRTEWRVHCRMLDLVWTSDLNWHCDD